MKYYATRFFLFVLSFTTLTSLSAQDKKNQSLLWRIQKGGAKPSFLFGTMHISDKKAFNFRDSLYTYLQQADAFALEFNPDSANQIIAAYMSGELNHSYENESLDFSSTPPPDLHYSINDTAISIEDSAVLIIDTSVSIIDTSYSLTDSTKLVLQSSGKVRGNLIDQFVERLAANKKREAESMNTFMDAYLYEMASQYGKTIYGLEELGGSGKVLKALSEGMKIDKLDLFSRWDPQNEESAVHRLYFEEDLDSLDLYYTEFFDEKTLDVFLYSRNKVMASRMDSIMKGQTLFAAVGAGHLTGDKGIIALLREKGYAVEPVFSEKRMPAGKFQIDVKRNWELIKKLEYGFQVSIPGLFKTQDAANGKKIIYHYDIGGGSFFMISFGKLSASEKEKSIHEVVTTHLDEWLNSVGGRVLSKKTVEHNGLKAIEAICLYNDNTYYRYRELIRGNLCYILAIGSEKKSNLFTEKAEEFVKSFTTTPIPSANWSVFESMAEGFSVLFPGKPQAEELQVDKEVASTIAAKTYSYFDGNNGTSYLVSIGKALAGHQYQEGEAFFETYVDHIKQASAETPVFTDTTMYGYPVKMFTGGSVTEKLRGLVIHRANTCYYVLAEFENNRDAGDAVEKFLRSFQLTAFEKPAWSLQQSPENDFVVWLPARIEIEIPDSTAYDFSPGEVKFYGHDPYASLSYNVEVYPINRYYWAPNLDSLYNSWKVKLVNSWSDSLVKFTTVSNGGITGREIWKFSKQRKEQVVHRLLLNGDKMYVLTASTPLIHADEKNARRFFEEFRLSKEKSAGLVLNNDPRVLFTDLQSKDSVVFEQAYEALSEVEFFRENIMLLMEKAILRYPVTANHYLTVNDLLLQKAQDVFSKIDAAESRRQVIEFITENYTKNDNLADSVRYYLLGMLASDKTKESYQLLNELLATKKLSADNSFRLFYKLYDSLALTSTLYPGLLDHLEDTTMNFAVVSLTRKLIDSSQLSPRVLLPVKTRLLNLARIQRTRLAKGETDDIYELPDLVELLGLLQQKEADEMIAGYSKVKNTRIRKSAALVLLKNKKAVSASVLLAIANDPQFRVELYEDLKKLQKEKLFPLEHRSQTGLAESYIFTAVFDEYEDYTRPELIFIKKLEYEYKGEQKVFYIFRANYEYEGTEEREEKGKSSPKIKESYFTVAGPFETDESIITIDEKDNISGMWYDEKFDGMKNDYFFSKYLEQRLKWQNEIKK